MDKEKMVVMLLLITIILSISSVAVTMSLNFDELKDRFTGNFVSGNPYSSVELVVVEAPVSGVLDEGN